MSNIRNWIGQHPKLSAWFALAVGMVIIVVFSARDVGLLPTQMLALVVATALARWQARVDGWQVGVGLLAIFVLYSVMR